MVDYSVLEVVMGQALDLHRRPVAVTYLQNPPAGITKFAGSEPSGCSFWRLAAAGMTFYTVPEDHCNCAMGSYTHGYPLTPERAAEFDRTLSRLTSDGYVKMEEVPSIPRLKTAPGIVVYSPLGDTPIDPDLAVFATRPMQAMMLQEAALRTGIGLQLQPFGRPTCMCLPAVLAQGMVTSAGCLGNRVYADLLDDELYVLIPGGFLEQIADAVQGIAESRAKLMEYHRQRRRSLGSLA